ncbi:MAG: helix-turn-helix domain-containing protein [Thermoleophilaceae bacterium]
MARPAMWQRTLLAAGRELGVDGLAAIAVGALERELEVLREDPDLLDAARASTVANLALVEQLASGDVSLGELEPPPQAAAFARELARRNVPVGELGRAYRVAQLALWRWTVAEVRRRIEGDEEVSAAIEAVSEAAFATGDVFSTMVMERYAVERDRWARSADAMRSATVHEILAGGPVDAAAAGARLRYELGQEHRAFVVWAGLDGDLPESAAETLGGGRALLVPMGVGVVAGWCPADAVAREPAGAAAVALGTPGSGIEGFRASHHEAMEARRVARLVGRTDQVVRYEDVALLALLTTDLEQARAFAARRLGPLAAGDEAARRLADTLLTVLEEQGSPRRAAQRLGVHENTVGKRLRAVGELLGEDPQRSPAELLAALLILRATRDG